MSVLHLNTNDINGGAARAAYRLHQGLRRIGEESWMHVHRKTSQDDTVEAHDAAPSLLQRIRDRVVRRWLTSRFSTYADTRPEGLELFSQARTVDGTRVVQQVPEADVYNLHWINGFIDPLPFFQYTQQPIVWTLHDMNPFTGGCHYNVGCRKFEDQCGTCPQLGSDDDTDLSRTVWTRKRRAYQNAIQNDRLHIVAPSAWLADEAQRSSLVHDAPVRVIPNGLDTSTFRPRDTQGLRSALEIPKAHRIVLFVAQSADNHRKGFDLLNNALSTFDGENITLLSIGGTTPDLEVSLPHQHLGTIESNLLLSVFYSLADLFVIPSRQDNLPNTVLESMACGTPVVGFEVGGIPDMVRPGKTGWLAEPESVRSLRGRIEQALSSDEARRRCGDRCREIVEEEYTFEVQARAYKELYEQVLNQHEKPE
jgi:glycosyltransferase involved in cell wall biosynthesis